MIFIVREDDILKKNKLYVYILFGRRYKLAKLYSTSTLIDFGFMEYNNSYPNPHRSLKANYITSKIFTQKILDIKKLF
ncbi:MAG: hypothetical protein ACOC1K_02205 [Nanoarchaeota archaeon]